MSGVGVLDVLSDHLEVRVEGLDNFIGLQSFRIVLAEFLELLLLIRRQLIKVFLAGHVDVLLGGLARSNLDVVDMIHLLIGRRIGLAEDERVGAGRDISREFTVWTDRDYALVGGLG